jgi:gamma-tubulin complex component 3
MEHNDSAMTDAVERLVTSISDDPNIIIPLAHRILASTSSLLTSSPASTMRRIERAYGKETRVNVEGLRDELTKVCPRPAMANEIVEVLSKIAMQATSPAPAKRSLPPIRSPIASRPPHQAAVVATDADELSFLRECLYVLQGMNGRHVQLDGTHLTVSMPQQHAHGAHSRLGSGARTALRQCAETAWLHARVQHYANHHGAGFCRRALAQALRRELHDYHAVVAAMDFELQQQESTLTLRQVLVNLVEPTHRLRILAMVTDGLASLKGGPLLMGLNQHSIHGDTRHSSLLKDLLRVASKPWFDALYMWTTQGLLLDPYDELFIVEDETVDDANMWARKYSVDTQKVPLGILDPTLVEAAFLVGKGIRFIRSNLQDLEWRLEFAAADEDDEDDQEQKTRLGYTAGGSAALRAWLSKAADQVNSHILASLRADLMQHLWALKQFLLLGQGDFFSVLMTGLYKEFENKIGKVGIYNYVLMGIVDTAIKSTNAAELPDFVLDRLQVELDVDAKDYSQYMFAAPKDGDFKDERTGWDVFMFNYVVPERLSAVLGEDERNKYRRVFSLLFGMKRVEFMLNLTWRQSTSLQHSLQTFAQYNGIRSSTNNDYAYALSLLRKISMTRQSMTHFVTNLKNYLFFEVLEGSWKLLHYQIEHARSLDDVIAAHNRYLQDVLHKSLLSESTEIGNTLSEQLKILLGLALLFCQFQEQLFSQALEAADRSAEKRRLAETRSKEGEWGFESEKEVAEENTFFGLVDKARFDEVTAIYDQFNAGTLQLMEGLEAAIDGHNHTMTEPESPSTERNPTVDNSKIKSTNTHVETTHDSLRFLTFQLDYSSFYSSQAS